MASVDQIKSLEPEAFEQFIGRLLEIRGFSNVLRLGGTNDEGIDLRAEWQMELPTGGLQSTVWAVQCKRYSRNLSQSNIQEILAAALEPSLDVFPKPVDYFLIATTSRLTSSAVRLVERANSQRQKYSCSFVVWDIDQISTLARDRSELNWFFEQPRITSDPASVSRLTVLADRSEGEISFTFFYEGPGQAPSCRVEKSALPVIEFDILTGNLRKLAEVGFVASPSGKTRRHLTFLGQKLAELLPASMLRALFDDDSKFIRITSNVHILPFELVQDPQSHDFLGTKKSVGRVQVSSSTHSPVWKDSPQVLLVGATDQRMIEDLELAPLPEAEGELMELRRVLQDNNLGVELIRGDRATRSAIREALSSKKFDLIHFTGHGLTAEQERFSPGLALADEILSFDELGNFDLSNAVVFLSLCSSGATLDQVSRSLVDAGVSAAVGFIGPLTDRGGAILAVRFYKELARGASLGEAVLNAKLELRQRADDDTSWITFVLFGDPSLRINLGTGAGNSSE